jgi:hypothetical protein
LQYFDVSNHQVALESMRASFYSTLYISVLAVAQLHAAVTAGSLAVIGYDDYLNSVTLVATEQLSAGEVVYVTNNGWSTATNSFWGADPTQGAGNQSLMKLTLNSNISAGTIIGSTVASADWTWTTSGIIPGQVGGSAQFSGLDLEYLADQIYVFQAGVSNPLLNPLSFIYAMHLADATHPTFSDAVDEFTGALPPALSLAAGTAYLPTALNRHGDEDGNHSAWSLYWGAPTISQLQSQGGSKAEWLAAITNSSNWAAAAPSAAPSALFITTPEPTRILLLGLGMGAAALRRQRRKTWKLTFEG